VDVVYDRDGEVLHLQILYCGPPGSRSSFITPLASLTLRGGLSTTQRHEAKASRYIDALKSPVAGMDKDNGGPHDRA